MRRERGMQAADALESGLHELFWKARHRNEWFRDCQEIRVHVDQCAHAWPVADDPNES